MAGFDWYQGSVQAEPNDVLSVLSGLAPDLVIAHERGRQGYAHTERLVSQAEGVVAEVWHGGTHPQPHFLCSGEWAQPGAELIRVAYPFTHTIARVDVREDFGEPDAFDRMQVQLLEVAERRGVKVGTAGDHLLTMRGRTTYLGSPTSAVRMRLYDKAQELRDKFAKDARRLATIPEHLARLEAQVRPATRLAKAQAATMEPVELLGCSRWMREVWKAVAGLDLEPVQVGRGYRQTDDERAYRYLLAQYGGVLRRMHRDAGSWECVGLQLGSDLAERH